MDASCSNPISRQIEIQVSGLQVYIQLPAAVWEYEPTLLPLEPRSKDQPHA